MVKFCNNYSLHPQLPIEVYGGESVTEKSKGTQPLWYFKQVQEIKGPFPSGSIRRFLILGRLSLDTEVSENGQTWMPLSEVAELMPPEFRKALKTGHLGDFQSLVLREDERKGHDRRRRGSDNSGVGQPRQVERRQPESDQVQRYRKAKTELRKLERSKLRIPISSFLVAATLILAAIGYGIHIGGSDSSPEPDCVALPAPGIDWRNCQLRGLNAQNSDLRGAILLNAALEGSVLTGSRLDDADLRYADLTAADLSFSELGWARMKGSSLRDADLSYADFSGVDLSFADLTGANVAGAVFQGTKLDHAIWTDGRTCQEGSTGSCRIEPAQH